MLGLVPVRAGCIGRGRRCRRRVGTRQSHDLQPAHTIDVSHQFVSVVGPGGGDWSRMRRTIRGAAEASGQSSEKNEMLADGFDIQVIS